MTDLELKNIISILKENYNINVYNYQKEMKSFPEILEELRMYGVLDDSKSFRLDENYDSKD